MSKRLLTLAAAAAFLIVVSPGPEARAAAAKLPMLKAETSDIVEVRKRRGYSSRGFHRRRAGSFHRPRFVHRGYHRPRHIHRHRYHRRWHRGPRFGIYIGPAYRSCAWLRHRAAVTGSRYWWRRYYRCRGWW